MVTCMAGTCDEVVHSNYWIYYIAPFLASYVVAEVTEWITMDLDAEEEAAEIPDKPTEESNKEPEKAVEETADV